jgi:hypothetical protein
MPKPIDCDELVYFVGEMMRHVVRILNGNATAEEERAAQKLGYASAFDEVLAFAQGERAEALAEILIGKLRYDIEPREWLEKMVIPEKARDLKPVRRREVGRLVKPIDGGVKMIFKIGGRRETITLRVKPQTTD